MADFDSSLPVRTETAGDVIVKVADATIPSQQLKVEADGSVNANISATDLDIRDLSAAQDNVAISDGTDTLAVNADGSINSVVSATDLDIRDLAFATDKVDVTGSDVTATVSATDLDIRDLSSAQDSVSVLQATHDSLNANANIQVGDVDVSNANPVPMSDAGGSITVDAVDLDIRDLSSATDSVTVLATDLDIRDLNSATDSVTVLATDLDVRDLSAAQDNVAISDGTDTLAVNTDGSINVVVQEDAGLEIVDYDTTASVAGGASDNHDWTSAAASKLYQVLASASGKLKIEVQVETGSATNVFNTVAVAFNSTATPNIDLDLRKFAVVPSGARVRVIRTNRDNQAQDVYSTIVAIQG